MAQQGIKIFTRPLRYHIETVEFEDGSKVSFPTKREKGIDVRIALDMVRLALDNSYDIALVFSQDQDLSEVADEIRAISIKEDRWIQVVSAFPISQTSKNKRGINCTKWVKISQHLYNACIDHRDYRPKKR